jgi:hypothetical protein
MLRALAAYLRKGSVKNHPLAPLADAARPLFWISSMSAHDAAVELKCWSTHKLPSAWQNWICFSLR